MKMNELAEEFETQETGKTEEGRLLDLIVKARTLDALDEAVEGSKEYQEVRDQQDMAIEKIAQAGLSEEQKVVVDRAISAVNDCGAVYGEVAYKLGMQDGIRLTSELKEI